MNRIPRASIVLSALAILSGLTFACSNLGNNQSYSDFQLQASQAGSTLTAKDESIAFLKQGADKAMSGDYPGAISEYNKSIRVNPNNADVYYNRGVAYYYLGKSQEALQDFSRTIELQPQFPEAYGNRGELRLQEGDKLGAIQDFQQAAKQFARAGDSAAAGRMNSLIKQVGQ